jgi:hypothetical protein
VANVPVPDDYGPPGAQAQHAQSLAEQVGIQPVARLGGRTCGGELIVHRLAPSLVHGNPISDAADYGVPQTAYV